MLVSRSIQENDVGAIQIAKKVTNDRTCQSTLKIHDGYAGGSGSTLSTPSSHWKTHMITSLKGHPSST